MSEAAPAAADKTGSGGTGPPVQLACLFRRPLPKAAKKIYEQNLQAENPAVRSEFEGVHGGGNGQSKALAVGIGVFPRILQFLIQCVDKVDTLKSVVKSIVLSIKKFLPV